MESWNEKGFRDLGLSMQFKQDNHSRSHSNVLRGLHYQLQRPQGKLVRAVRGRIFDVAVDIRRSSPAFGKWVGVELDEDNGEMLWIPPGFAHGFLVSSGPADVLYKTTDFYYQPGERTILWNDPTLRIAWPLQGTPIVSDKDAQGATLKTADLPE